MATNNSTTPTPTPQAEQQPVQQQPLLAYDLAHEDVLYGEIPEIYFDLHRAITIILRDQAQAISPELRHQLIAANTISDKLWYALLRLGKESHQTQQR